MVKVSEVLDEDIHKSPYASSESSRTASTDSLASVSSTGSSPESESIIERISALVDIIPPKTRSNISEKVSKTFGFLKTSSKVVGNVVWVVTTSALLVGLPLALSLEDEAKIVAQEKELQAQQQGQQMLANPGLYPSTPAPQGIVPPGF
ncbi:mitochondrial import receptor protein [Tulasnella sp. 419]|nr:mitochondrial import receptor protein [Tulasnella sp. 418]KAG8966940.1 mitochondrial import receptor protein [Tulasnella sp. 419]